MLRGLHLRLKEYLQRTFDIRFGEFRRVWLMLVNIYLLVLCLWIIKPIVNAQFLSRVGVENLPLVFFMVAMTALAVSTLYSNLLDRIALGTAILRTYLISILCLLTFAILFDLRLFQDWMIYVLYVGTALFGLITTSQFWLLGNFIFNSLEAKRLFGFIGAGAIAGGISGGYFTSILAPFMDSTNLLYVASGLLVICLLINRRIWLEFVNTENRKVQAKQTKRSFDYPLQLIRRSKHLTYLAFIIGISVVVAKLVEYQYSAIASAKIEDADNLTAFFGFWFSTANAVSLGIQLLATQRIISFLGVGRSLFVLPGALFAGAAMTLYAPVLWAGTALKVLDISLKQSINKAATELLILPVPLAIKKQAKTFIDVFVDATATGIGGIILIFLINGFNLSVRAVCVMILVLICVWIYLAIQVRKEYVRIFREKLGINRGKNKKALLRSNSSVVEGIRRTLRSGSPQQILFLLERIEEGKDQRLMQDVVPLLKHESALIRQAALRCLYYHTDHSVIRQIEPLLKDPDEDVRSRAFASMLAHTRHDRIAFIKGALNNEDPAISGAALVGLATEARDNPQMKQLFNLPQRIREKIEGMKKIEDHNEIVDHKILLARAIGYGKLQAFYPLLKEYMQDEDLAVRNQAALSAGSSGEKSFIPILLPLLSKKTTRETAKRALSRFEAAEIYPLLSKLSRDAALPKEVTIQLPTLAEINDAQAAIDFLFELAQYPDPDVKLKALKTLHNMRVSYPHLKIETNRISPLLKQESGLYKDLLALSYTLQRKRKDQYEGTEIESAKQELLQLLKLRLDNTVVRIFWMLEMNYPAGSIVPLYKDLENEDPVSRINTIELLDNILEPSLKKLVIPIIESASSEPITKDVLLRLDVELLQETEAFEILLKGEDGPLKLAALKLIGALENPAHEYLLQIAAMDENPKVRMMAKTMLEK